MSDSDETLPDFDEKIVVCYIGVERKSATIATPHFELQGAKLFLVGEACVSSGHWAEGAVAAVAWDSVSSYLAFERDAWPTASERISAARKKRVRGKKSIWPWS